MCMGVSVFALLSPSVLCQTSMLAVCGPCDHALINTR